MTLVGDVERERAVATLRRSYRQGRLTLDELAARTGQALNARTRAELRRALRDLPGWWAAGVSSVDWDGAVRTTLGLVRFGVFFAVWMTASFVILLALVAALVFAASATVALAFALMWLLVTWLLWRGFRGRAYR